MAGRLRFFYRALRYRYWVDPAELRFIDERLRSGQVAVDAGCHKGAYTFWMRRCVGPNGEVIAFEPQPRQAEYLRAIFDQLQYRNVTLVPRGLSNAQGRLRLHVPTSKGATHQATFVADRRAPEDCEPVDVEVTTLDTFFATHARRPDFLKIDVEGHEQALLAGARQTLEAHRPTVLIECESRHRPDQDVRPVLDLFAALGYQGSFFRRGRRHPLAEFDPDEHQPRLSAGAKPPPGYVNNFAFVHPTRL